MRLNELKKVVDELINEGYGELGVEVIDSVYGYTVDSWDIDHLNDMVQLLPGVPDEYQSKHSS